ncbi:MAG: 3-hydroxybutyryl-CoA dehydrogenase [Flavobacteriales bacterium]|nr:3-hydroxybutyryl-CoA dehydrogenase [Bacteroidota bacterium]MCB9240869.1 3-hydroxybutyryl-CoA dehydrogenase [Flavobacteriales bacterium]
MKTAVIGAGVMGAGIAQVFAQAGHSVILYDVNPDSVHKALGLIEKNLNKGIELGKVSVEDKSACLSNISTTDSLISIQADLIIEAIVERLDVKVELFKTLAANNAPDCILATNTSSIPITQIAAAIPNPERVVGIHFFNPAHLMKLVEIVSGAHTNDSVAQRAYDFAAKLGKTPIMAKDAPGFIVNRVARHYYVEGLKTLEEKVANFDAIDRLLESSGFRMGPFRLMDLIGVETNFSVTESMYNLFYQDGKFRPSRIQKQKVDAGHFGRKTGKGFYTYNT